MGLSWQSGRGGPLGTMWPGWLCVRNAEGEGEVVLGASSMERRKEQVLVLRGGHGRSARSCLVTK